MRLRSRVLEIGNALLKQFGYELVNDQWHALYQDIPTGITQNQSSELPPGAEGYLRLDNPRLVELSRRYALFDERVTTPYKWSESTVTPTDLLFFRGNNPYVWQLRGMNMNQLAYALATYYVCSIDDLMLLDQLQEDGAFGAVIFPVAGKIISRDLIDSIIEIYFLEKHLAISTSPGINILDIGAGYGRLAYRMVTAFPDLGEYLCTDGYPASTFLSEYYLQYRNLAGRARAIPLDEIESILNGKTIDIALNIHSFPECRLSAIDWWLTLLERHRVRYLMIVPNIGDSLKTHEGHDFSGLIEQHGYRLVAKEPKYRDPVVQLYGMMPVYHYLFELAVAS